MRPALPRWSTVLRALLFGLALCSGRASALLAQEWTPDLFGSMTARNIGPAGMSGRVTGLHPTPAEVAQAGDDDEDSEDSEEVAPGRYTVTIRVGGEEGTTTVDVIGDPRKEGAEFFIGG